MSTKSYRERIPPKSRNAFSFNKFIYFSFMLPSQSSRLLINSNDKISISFQKGQQLKKGFHKIVLSEPFIGKNVKIQVMYSGRKIGGKTSVCLRAEEVYGCEIPQGKTFFAFVISLGRKCVTSSYHGSKMSEFCLS